MPSWTERIDEPAPGEVVSEAEQRRRLRELRRGHFPRPPWNAHRLDRRPRLYLGGVEWYTIRLPRGWKLDWRLTRGRR